MATSCTPRVTDRVVYFQVVPVKIHGENGVAPIDTFAILDDGSSDTLIREDIADKLKLEGTERLLSLEMLKIIEPLEALEQSIFW